MTPGEIRAAIVLLNTTQVGLARSLELHLRTVTRYVSGEHAIPRVVEYAIKYLLSHPGA